MAHRLKCKANIEKYFKTGVRCTKCKRFFASMTKIGQVSIITNT